jgi:flagellar biosynthetic protein FlhB
MDSSSQDKNLPASERKLKNARDEGQVARSRDFSHFVILGGGGITLIALSSSMFNVLKENLSKQLNFTATDLIHPASMLGRLGDMVLIGLVGCVIFGAITTFLIMTSTVAVGGWVSSLKPITPDFSRVNPLAGFGRLFTQDKFVDVMKMSAMTALVLAIGYAYLSAGLKEIANLVLQPSSSALQHLVNWLTNGLGLLILVLLLIAMIDVPLQIYLHKSKMKMSHQEVKQEGKESDGNPQMKNRLRQRQREIANGNSVTAVPKADFVLMNPTHYAVAIMYDEKTMHAPKVISKGADLIAIRIREVAAKNAIPVLESPVLARALFAHAELNQDIPASLFTAVAQVLAYIYKLKAAMRGEGPMPGEVPIPSIPSELDPHSSLTAESRLK